MHNDNIMSNESPNQSSNSACNDYDNSNSSKPSSMSFTGYLRGAVATPLVAVAGKNNANFFPFNKRNNSQEKRDEQNTIVNTIESKQPNNSKQPINSKQSINSKQPINSKQFNNSNGNYYYYLI